MFKYATCIEDIPDSYEEGYLYIFDTNSYDRDTTVFLENTSKMGKTDKTIKYRLKQYGINVKNISYINCTLPDKRERLIKAFLKHKTWLKPVCGVEYFKDCRKELENIILQFCSYDEPFIKELYSLYNSKIKYHKYLNKVKKDLDNKVDNILSIDCEKFECLKCNKYFTTLETLSNHEKKCNIYKTYECKACGKNYLSKIKLSIHEEICLPYIMNINNPLKGKIRDEIMEIVKKRPEENKEQSIIKQRYNLNHNLSRLKPLDLSKDRLHKIIEEHYNYDVYRYDLFVYYIIYRFFCDDKEDINAILTDKLSLLCITNDNTICIHTSVSLFNLYSSSNIFKDRIKEYYFECTKFVYDECVDKEDYNNIMKKVKSQFNILENKNSLNKGLKDCSYRFLKMEYKPKEIEPYEATIKFIEE